MKYRHELKFEVSDMELEIIKYRLRPIMKMDSNQDGSAYSVRSLYFDDLHDTRLKENEDGVDNRHKYRLRIYNGGRDVIKLEKKSKLRGMTRKESIFIPEAMCRRYMEGKAPELTGESSDLEKELYCEIKMCGMLPKSIVEYERTAFVEPRGNVRITFDRNLCGSMQTDDFLEERISGVPMMPAGKHILEVKYDEFLPEYISWVMEIGSMQRTAFSKYYYSRTI